MSIQIVEIASDQGVSIVEIRQGPAGEAGASVWGDIGGTLSDQADLQAALDLKAPLESPTFTGTVTADHIHGNLAGSVYLHIRAGEALSKGDPVYVYGSHGTGSAMVPIVMRADASNPAKMPAIAIMDAAVANNGSGHAVISGTIADLNTAAYSINSTLYVANGGGMTATKPANAQPVARVERSNANNGGIVVKVNGLYSDILTAASIAAAMDSASPAQELSLRQSIALAGHVGVPPTQPESVLFRDLGGGDNINIAAAGTRAVDPGPGTLTVSTLGGSSTARYENGRLYLTAAGSGNVHAIAHAGQVNLAAGMTLVCRLIPAAAPGVACANTVGFNHNATAFTPRRGGIQFVSSRTSSLLTLNVPAGSSSSDDGVFFTGSGIVRPGEEIAVAVRHRTLTEQEYYIQGGQAADFGCELGSENWYLIGRTSVDNTGLTAFPGVGIQFGGTAVIRSLELFSDWSPSPRCQTFDLERGKIGIHVPALETDPTTGLVVAAWNNGTSHVEQDTKIQASVRLANGTWTNVQTLVPAPGGGNGVHICSLSQVGGQLWLTHWFATGATDGGVLRRRILTVNPTTGVITVGAEQILSGLESGSTKLALAPIVTTASGALILPYHHGSPTTAGSFVGRSTDGGATWTPIQVSTVPAGQGITWLVEPSVVRESGNALGCYIRTNGGSTFYSRSTDDGLTWTTATRLAAIPNPNSRCIARRFSNGRNYLIGNESLQSASPNTFRARRNITVWEVGDNGIVLGKTRIGNFGPDTAPENGNQILQYPALLEDGDDMLIAYSHQPTAGIGISSCCIRVHAWRWTDPLAREAGGTGRRDRDLVIPTARQPRMRVANMDYASTMTPDMSLASLFYVTLTATPATGFAAPLNPLPWEELTLVIIQGGTGSYTAAFNAIFEFGGITPTWQTAVGASNILRAIYNPIQAKWRVTSFL